MTEQPLSEYAMSITNQHTACTVINLDPAHPRTGPFVVTQHHVDAGDPTQRENLYLLRRDGAWVEYGTQILSPPSGRVPAIFESLKEIVDLMNQLPPTPTVIRDETLDQKRLQAFLHEVDAKGGMLAHIRSEIAAWRQLQQRDAPP